MRGRPWTESEEAILRDLYPRVRGPERVSAATGYSVNAVRVHAKLLGVRAKRQSRAWTTREDRVLTMEWGDVGARVLRSKLPGRSWVAILSRVVRLGLGSPAQGRVSLVFAAKVCGYSYPVFKRILFAQGVVYHHHPGGRLAAKRVQHRYLVDLDEAREAVARHLAADTRETLRQAADRVGLTPRQVEDRLKRAGLLPKAVRGSALRVDPSSVDRAVAAWVRMPMGPRSRPGVARCGAERAEECAA